jgi:tetratricopeptide (TPR) repeat protein
VDWWLIIYVVLGLSILIILGFVIAAGIRWIIIKTSKEIPVLQEGMEALNRNDLNFAMKKFNEALEIKPQLPEAYYGIAKVYELKNENEKALENLTHAVTLKERFPAAYHDIGWIYQKQGELEKAIEYYVKAVSQKRKFIQAHMNIGAIYVMQGKYREALEKFDDAVFIDPKYVNAYTSATDVLLRMGKYNEAIQVCEELEKQAPEDVNSYFYRGVAYYFLNQKDKMEEMKSEISEINPVIVQDFDQFIKNVEQHRLQQQQQNQEPQ